MIDDHCTNNTPYSNPNPNMHVFVSLAIDIAKSFELLKCINGKLELAYPLRGEDFHSIMALV